MTIGSVAASPEADCSRAKGRLGAPRVGVRRAVARRQARIRIGGLTRSTQAPVALVSAAAGSTCR